MTRAPPIQRIGVKGGETMPTETLGTVADWAQVLIALMALVLAYMTYRHQWPKAPKEKGPKRRYFPKHLRH